MCKMDFHTKASNVILVNIFQMKILIFQQFVFKHSYACLNEKHHFNVFCEIT
jgi:hypothetical protein